MTTTHGDAALFPYTQAQQLTKQYLGRKKSQEDTDARLLELIRQHGHRELAFAACASFLSIGAVHNFLGSPEYEIGSTKPQVLANFLQAFVAAAYCKCLDFELRDRTFATILVAVAADPGAESAATLHMLVSAWRAGEPGHEGLRARAVALTATALHNARLVLERLRVGWKWAETERYRAPLVQMHVGNGFAEGRTAKILEGCVGEFLPGWRAWAKWTPRVVSAVWRGWVLGYGESRGAVRMREQNLRCLLEVEGPDVVEGGEEAQGTLWRGLVRRRGLVAWLEGKGFKIGAGLIFDGDTEGLLLEFVGQFQRVLDTALGDGAASLGFSRMFIEREGLDAGTLTAWEDARTLLIERLPKFVEHIVDPKVLVDSSEKFDVDVVSATAALQPANRHPVRSPIIVEIAQCVQLACNELDTDIRVCMYLLSHAYEWLAPAMRLWHLREKLASATWLHGAVDKSLLQRAISQPLAQDLQVLKELHFRIKTLGESKLLERLNAYVHCYVLDGDLGDKVLAPALHTLWAKAQDRATREAAITLASLDDVRMDIRSACITALGVATGAAAEQLHDRLLQVQAKVTAAYIDLTEVILSLTGLVNAHACWAGLLWALLKQDGVFIDQPVFTDRGVKAYMQWISSLQSLFGDKLDFLGGTSAWMQELGPVSSVLEELEAMNGSMRVVHRLLTTTKLDPRCWHLRILANIDREKRKDRREYLLTVLLSLNAYNASAIDRVTSSQAALRDSEFQRCQRFLTYAREDKDMAAATLAISLNMSEFSPMLKEACVDVGAALGLKESPEA